MYRLVFKININNTIRKKLKITFFFYHASEVNLLLRVSLENNFNSTINGYENVERGSRNRISGDGNRRSNVSVDNLQNCSGDRKGVIISGFFL